ncbi:MAG TPA: cob(I)yrinic acid a,c-diamide adenosyltransferase [Geopsychrobacteraceae bacterium]|nr:cob(I)yrinic acid a,c-diamide adenosyltransferase [Geopsychrobacteraceae bacterium]
MPKIDRVTTKGGDKGKTSLVDGSRVAKCSLRVCAYGTVDELNSCLGLVRCEVLPDEILKRLLMVQHELFDLGGELATPTASAEADHIPNIRQHQIDLLESWLEEANNQLQPAKNFILPGGSRAAAQLHIARTVARRAERKLVALIESGAEINPCCLKFLNRLSDLCFVWARLCNNCGQDDIFWKPGPHR